MNSKKYFSRYYKGENEPPQSLSQRGRFFWDYENTFYQNNPTTTQEEFDTWLLDLLTNYLPYKMMYGPVADEAKLIQQWKDDYENS